MKTHKKTLTKHSLNKTFYDSEDEVIDSGAESDSEVEEELTLKTNKQKKQEKKNRQENDAEAEILSVMSSLKITKPTQAVNAKPKLPAYKKHLFVGEGDFTFAEAYLKKKQAQKKKNIAQSITASEYMSKDKVIQSFGEPVKKRIESLKEQGMKVKFEVDASHLEEAFPDQRFHRIHFNFPHHGGSFNDKNEQGERILPSLLASFFKSAKLNQKLGDRVYVTLPKIVKPKALPNRDTLSVTQYQEFYDAYIYNIFEAAARAGYKPLAKHWFRGKREDGEEEHERYSGYQHAETGRAQSAEVAQNAREWVFEKTELTFSQIESAYPSIHYKTAYNEKHLTMPNIDTDYESSDAELSDKDSKKAPTPPKASVSKSVSKL